MKLQVYDREIGRPKVAQTSQRNLSIGTETPKAVSRLGVQLEKIGSDVASKVKAADQVMEYSKIIADTKMEMGVFYSSRSKDTENYDTLADDTDAHFKKLSASKVKGIKDVTQAARIRQGLDQIGAAMHTKAVGDATTQAIDNTKATHKHTRALMVQEASYGSDDQMRSVMMNYAEQTRTLANLGVFHEDDAEKDVLDFYNDAARGKVRRLMNQSPSEAINYLLDQTTFSRMLKPEHRENLLAQAQRLQDAEDRRAEAAAKALEAKKEKQLKLAHEYNYIRSFNSIIAGDMSAQDLQAQGEAGLLKATDYASLYKISMNRNKEWVGNAEIQSTMLDQAWMGELELRDVQIALQEEQINWDGAQKLVDEIEKGATITQTEGYKTHLIALKTAVGWSPSYVPTPKQAEMISQAILEFRTRLIAGENVTMVTDEMIKRYKSSSMEYHPRPRYQTESEAMLNIPAGPRLDAELRAIRYHAERNAANTTKSTTDER